LREELHDDLYRQIFLHSTDSIAILDLDGHYLKQNEAHHQLLGYSASDLENQTPAIHLGAEVFAEIARELSDKGEFRGDLVSQTKSGETKYLEWSAFSVRKGGEPVCYAVIKRDITERKQVEEALHRNEAQLTDFFENSAVAMHWVGPDASVLRVNRAELDMLGYTRDEYEGHNISEFHADRRAIGEILSRLQAGEVLENYEARLRCKDGSIKLVHISSSVYREAGKFIHTRCFTQDITKRKRTEGRLALQYAVTRILSESNDLAECGRNILQAACDNLDWEVGAIWKVDHSAQVIRNLEICHATSKSTPDFDRLTKGLVFEKGEGLPGSIWATGEPVWVDNIINDPNYPRSGVALREGLRGSFGFPILIGNDVWGVMEFFSSEIREPDDELIKLAAGIGGQIGQFSERRRAEEERAELLKREQAARADAEKANRLKDEFLATLSHELRTPLNAVIGWSRMLGSGRLDQDSAKHALDVIERNAWAQKQIIEDILDVSRVITGKLQLNLGPVDLIMVVDAALDAVRPALEAKEINIETIIGTSLRLVSGDADRLQQVVWNVLSNAAKFTPAGGKVEISLSQTVGHVQIQIKDSGPGIDPAFLPHVFERFRQADGSTTRTHGGLGLGLAIVRHLVELHGGTIAVENRDDASGAIFTILLPLPSGELHPETLARASSLLKEHAPTRLNLEGLRILVVDDETDALDLIGVELAQHGAQVKGVASAEEALAALDEGPFDLLISDIGMPRTDGYELIRQIRAREQGQNHKLPAVALTAYARVQDRMQAIMAGFSTHVAKPVEANELITVVASLVGRL
jgi:PAS domain S-box-containing protein